MSVMNFCFVNGYVLLYILSFVFLYCTENILPILKVIIRFQLRQFLLLNVLCNYYVNIYRGFSSFKAGIEHFKLKKIMPVVKFYFENTERLNRLGFFKEKVIMDRSIK